MSRTGTTGDDWRRDHPELFANVQGAGRFKNLAQPTPRKQPRSIEVPMLRRPERAGDVICIWLPLPHKVLHKNGRTKNLNWKAKLTAGAKEAAKFTVRLVLSGECWSQVRIDAKFWLERKHDDDGLAHWIVPYRDGIAAAMSCSDSGFVMGNITQHTGKESQGRREVEICITRLS